MLVINNDVPGRKIWSSRRKKGARHPLASAFAFCNLTTWRAVQNHDRHRHGSHSVQGATAIPDVRSGGRARIMLDNMPSSLCRWFAKVNYALGVTSSVPFCRWLVKRRTKAFQMINAETVKHP
jgi:hypothetical protein